VVVVVVVVMRLTPTCFVVLQAYDNQIVESVVRSIKESDTDYSALGESRERRTAQGTAGLLVGHGTALEIHGVPEYVTLFCMHAYAPMHIIVWG